MNTSEVRNLCIQFIETHNQIPNCILVGDAKYKEMIEFAKQITHEEIQPLILFMGLWILIDPEQPNRFSVCYQETLSKYVIYKHRHK